MVWMGYRCKDFATSYHSKAEIPVKTMKRGKMDFCQGCNFQLAVFEHFLECHFFQFSHKTIKFHLQLNPRLVSQAIGIYHLNVLIQVPIFPVQISSFSIHSLIFSFNRKTDKTRIAGASFSPISCGRQKFSKFILLLSITVENKKTKSLDLHLKKHKNFG